MNYKRNETHLSRFEVGINPEVLNEFLPLKEASEIVNLTESDLNCFADKGEIPYKMESGKKFFRRGSLIRFKHSLAKRAVESTGERFAKDWKD